MQGHKETKDLLLRKVQTVFLIAYIHTVFYNITYKSRKT